MRHIWRHILNFLLPPRCISCGRFLAYENGLCPDCFNQTTFIAAPYCRRCGLPFASVDVADKKMLCPACLEEKKPLLRLSRAAVKYDEAFKNNILAFKFMDKTQNAEVFAKLLKTAGKDIFDQGVDVLMPVPLHFRRLLKRRYNQSALLASALSRLTGVPTDVSSLVKFKATKPQVSFSGKARIRNVKGAFRVKYPENVKGKHIVLIDDVMTTGSTLRECAKVLLEAGAASVDSLTVARVYD